MTYEEDRQRIKNEALNKIAKIYNPKYKFPYDSNNFNIYDYDDAHINSRSEQREDVIQNIIMKMHRDLRKIKREYKLKLQNNERL